MPDIYGRDLSRRRFLKGGLALAAGVATLGPRRLLGDDQSDTELYKDDCTRWAFLSDTHIAADPENRYRGFYPYQNLLEVTAQIADDLPDGLVITGDLSRLKGKSEAYENLRTLLTPLAEHRPICLGIGNHDNRGDFFQAFGGYEGSGTVVENRQIITTNSGPVRLIVLDTLLFVNAIPGLLGRSQRTWLEAFLQTCDDRPTILLLHHTPQADLLDTARLFKIIGPTRKVKAVVYGHSHKYHFSQHGGIHLINLPATGFNFRGNQPVGWVEARLTATGGEFTLHAIGGNLEYNRRVQKLRWRV